MAQNSLLRGYHLNVFTDQPFSGNPATVFIDSIALTGKQMQVIARECNTPETIFIREADGNIEVRFFTPQEEVPSCGHGTLAAMHVLHSLGNENYREKTWLLNTLAGEITCNVNAGELSEYRMSASPLIAERASLAHEQVNAVLLSADIADIQALFVVKNQQGGQRLLIQMASPDSVLALKPDMGILKSFQAEHKFSGCFCFAAEDNSFSTFHGRMFAPIIGINEDPVNGNSSIALGAVVELLSRERHIACPDHIRVLQGTAMGRPGVVGISIVNESVGTYRIFLTGNVTQVYNFQLSPPLL